MAVQLEFLQSIPYFSGLGPTELHSIKKLIFEKTAERGEIVLLEGEPADGLYFVASGVFAVFGGAQPVLGSKNVTDYICGELEDIVGGRFAFEEDPIKAAHLMIEHIDKKRAALKLKGPTYATTK